MGFFLDDKIHWWEALIMFLFYFCYVGFMFINKKVKKFADENLKWLKKGKDDDFEENEEPKEGNPWTDFDIGIEDDDSKIKKIWKYFYFAISLPIFVVLKIIPDVRYKKIQDSKFINLLLIVSFILCLLAITGCSYCMVWWTTRF